MIDVMFLVQQFGRGGTERQVALVATTLANLGQKVAILVPTLGNPDHAPFRTPGVELFEVDRRHGRPVAFLQMLRFARTRRPRVIHCFSFQLNFYAHLLAKSCGAVGLGGVRSGFDRMREDTPRALWHLCLRYPGVIACNSAPAAERIVALERPWAPHTTLVVPNAIDLRRFPEPVDHAPRDHLRLIGIGNLREEKRWHLAIEAVARLNAGGKSCKLTILGRGPTRAELERRIAELGAHDHVELVGNVESVDEYLLESDVLLHTAGSEGSPNAIIEGMSAGLACVATAVGEVPNLLAGERGLVVPLDDVGALVDALGRVCSDHELRRRLGRTARDHAERHFDAKARAGHWERIYAALLSGTDIPDALPKGVGA